MGLISLAIRGIIAGVQALTEDDNSTQQRSPYSGGGYVPPAPPPQFEVSVSHETNWKGKGVSGWVFRVKGPILVPRAMYVEFVSLVLDITDNSEGEAVFCLIPQLQHHEHNFFQSVREGPLVSPDQGFRDWVEIGFAPSDFLVFPKSGGRRLKFIAYMCEKSPPESRSPLCVATQIIYHNVEKTGYKEIHQKRIGSLRSAILIAFAIARSDGSVDSREVDVMRGWCARKAQEFPDELQFQVLMEIDGFVTQCQSGQANASQQFRQHSHDDVNSLANSIRQSDCPNAAEEALELCVMVMSADGIISPAEISLIDRVASSLGLPPSMLSLMRDKHVPVLGETSLTDEQLLGVDSIYNREELRSRLLDLFKTYNSRLQIERDPNKRARNQRMLDAIGRVRSRCN